MQMESKCTAYLIGLVEELKGLGIVGKHVLVEQTGDLSRVLRNQWGSCLDDGNC